jgi:hypothetical protein
LDRIRTLLSGGQFNLFGESPETAEARQEANKRRDVDSAMQLDG